ncbi:IucA/IucC family protein [Halobacillus karajensis]|uniref:N(2)-citryl-N(6)-acetyl-N(6)-hydroxylysine synthase n=1 Tax=Halobacillus karajensis TaxID=195088 RepID=A0A024P9C0_9BACI|nr:IucA/IucC family protein [Halobacillus karajensis]CDQ20914.1 N(2)-citryl-N(6)-acetyl-N(6)-hydroxylysine synthase [Halobacillus karajensis]CDQ25022.1 N(2)-citryl-N(6)-acetyl-N(6)-hydroxylysine synthase [Halobacillus karajensis]CDQ28617.1 N(2)-citryl-N(6)-acetyl-N(6)-hydroxylysine synthase [Halobacillus karajensis]
MILPLTDHLRGLNKGLWMEEEKCVQFLKDRFPSRVSCYFRNCERARKSILAKLSNSIFRENLEEIQTKAIAVVKKEGNLYVDGCLSEEKRIPKDDLVEGRTYQLIHQGDNQVFFPIKRMSAFQFVEVGVPLVKRKGTHVRSVESASDLVHLLFQGESYKNVDRFVQELNNGSANLALAYTFHEEWKKKVKEEADRLEVYNSLDYVLEKGNAARLFYEQLVVEGHHLHPGAKTKLGLTYKDAWKYSPEYHQSFPIRLVAVRKEHILANGTSFASTFPELNEKAKAELRNLGCLEKQFLILPVHPWQYDHVVPTIYDQEIENGDIVLLPKTQLEAEATSSFRTVAPTGGHSVVKLAVNSQMTSTVRSISTQTALNSTVFSEMIQQIKANEPQLESFVPLNEKGGAAFHSEDVLKSRNLTMLIRESIEDHLEEGEVAVAGMSLYAESPISERSVLHELVQKHQIISNQTEEQAVREFFTSYVNRVLPGYLTMMVKYGVALEGHLQNSIPVFKNGRLSRFFFRDWGGARVFPERLRKQGISPKFAADSVSVTNDHSTIHNKLYYTVFQNHLGEIIRQLVQYADIPEQTFWAEVKRVCERVLDTLAERNDLVEQVEEDRKYLFQATVMHKSLTKMRLTNSPGDGYNAVPNPLV